MTTRIFALFWFAGALYVGINVAAGDDLGLGDRAAYVLLLATWAAREARHALTGTMPEWK